MTKHATLISFMLGIVFCQDLHADVFGSGEDQFEIAFVTIGDPRNKPLWTERGERLGGVPYTYRMATTEFTVDAAMKADRLGKLELQYDFVASDRPDAPMTGITWDLAARIVNWMNKSEGYQEAYNYSRRYNPAETVEPWQQGDKGYQLANPLRNSLAHYFLPTDAEWYKAAYYDPEQKTYWEFASGSNEPPSPVLSGTDADTAVYGQAYPFDLGPADAALAGGTNSFGIRGMAGNVNEWNELLFAEDLPVSPSFPVDARGVMGCHWQCGIEGLRAMPSGGLIQSISGYRLTGFRVASQVPEPTQPALFWMLFVVLSYRRKLSR